MPEFLTYKSINDYLTHTHVIAMLKVRSPCDTFPRTFCKKGQYLRSYVYLFIICGVCIASDGYFEILHIITDQYIQRYEFHAQLNI